MKKLGICIPTYNRTKTLLKQLDVIVKTENKSDFDIIINNNCSTDDYSLVEDICIKENFKYVKNISNIGIHMNLANSFLFAKDYEYFWVLSDDDILFEDAIDRVLEILNNNDLDFLCLSDVIKEKDYFEIKDYKRDELSLDFLLHKSGWFTIVSAIIYKTSYIKDSIPFAYKSYYPDSDVFFHSIYRNNNFKICTTSSKNYYQDFEQTQEDGDLRSAKIMFGSYFLYEYADESDRKEYIKKISSFFYVRHYIQHYYITKKSKRDDARDTLIRYSQLYGYLSYFGFFTRTKFFIWKMLYPTYRWIMDLVPNNLKDKGKIILGLK